MKKIILNIVLAVLCLNFSADAQDKTGLKIGDQVPDITISNIINYKGTDDKPATTAKISDFRGKLLILDFWATWCSPCVAMIPKMDSLQKQFAGKVQFLPVAYQSQKEVQVFMDKFENQQHKIYDLPDAVADTALKGLFPHTYLPHYVWINKDGVVSAITEFSEVNTSNISNLLKGININSPVKIDDKQVSYNDKKPLIIDSNGGDGSNLLYHSMITGYKEGLSGRFSIKTDKTFGKKITAINDDLYMLYRVAYLAAGKNFSIDRTIFRVKDSSQIYSPLSGMQYVQWLKESHAFCYELIVPSNLANQAAQIMLDDLNRFFSNYQTIIEKRTTKCLVFVSTISENKLKSIGGQPQLKADRFGWNLQNGYLNDLVYRLNVLQLSNYKIIDETDIKGRVDLNVSAGLSDLKALNRELNKFHLELKETERETEYLVFEDR